MKKFKHLPTILVMVLCIAVIAVGIYAIQPTHNTIKGNVTIGASNPAVNLTVYYVPNGVTVEDAVLNDANKIGTTKTARYGVELELTDSRLDFGMDYINEVDEVNAQTIAIKIENTSTQVLGAYFTDESDVTKVKTNLPLSTYSSSTSFTEENLVPGYAEADFSGYTQVPAKEGGANGEAIVTMSISLLDLPTIELYIEIDSILIIEEYDSTKSVNLETDAHLAVNVTQEDYTYSPTALSTTDTSVDAEVYQAGEGIYVG
ncbi:MAG: hypothetical protein IJW25_00685, partial [Clostridia bacterium]|nr:hypothetical protein [Clostridia bacterium]